MSRTRSCQDALLVGRTHCSFAVMAYILIRSRSFASLPHTPGSVRGISESTGSRNFTRRALVFPALDLCDNVPAPFANWTRTTSVPDVRNSEMIGSYPSSKVISINLESVEELEKVYSATDLAPLHQLARSRKEPTQLRPSTSMASLLLWADTLGDSKDSLETSDEDSSSIKTMAPVSTSMSSLLEWADTLGDSRDSLESVGEDSLTTTSLNATNDPITPGSASPLLPKKKSVFRRLGHFFRRRIRKGRSG